MLALLFALLVSVGHAADTVVFDGPLQSGRVALGSSAATQVTISSRYTACTFSFKQADDATDDSGMFAFAGTDAVAIGNDHMPVASGGAYEIVAARTGRGRVSDWVVFLEGTTASGFAHYSCES